MNWLAVAQAIRLEASFQAANLICRASYDTEPYTRTGWLAFVWKNNQ